MVVGRDFSAAVACAESFHRMGESLVLGVSWRVPEGSYRKMHPGTGDLVCGATNLALGVELYLKAAHIGLSSVFPRTHDLWKLYRALPDDVKQQVEEHYERLRKSVPPGVYASITVAKGPIEPPEWPDYRKTPKDIESVLQRSHDVFVSWRYLFEVRLSDNAPYEFHELEYLLLNLICEAMDAFLQDRAT